MHPLDYSFAWYQGFNWIPPLVAILLLSAWFFWAIKNQRERNESLLLPLLPASLAIFLGIWVSGFVTRDHLREIERVKSAVVKFQEESEVFGALPLRNEVSQTAAFLSKQRPESFWSDVGTFAGRNYPSTVTNPFFKSKPMSLQEHQTLLDFLRACPPDQDPVKHLSALTPGYPLLSADMKGYLATLPALSTVYAPNTPCGTAVSIVLATDGGFIPSIGR